MYIYFQIDFFQHSEKNYLSKAYILIFFNFIIIYYAKVVSWKKRREIFINLIYLNIQKNHLHFIRILVIYPNNQNNRDLWPRGSSIVAEMVEGGY